MAVGASKRNLTGTDAHDILVGLSREDGRSVSITGGNGWDTLIAGHPGVTVDTSARNRSIARALDIDDASLWSTAYDPLLGSAVAHTTVLGLGTGTVEYFSFTAQAGATITIDIDFPRTNPGLYWWLGRFELYRADGSYVPRSGSVNGGYGIESGYPFEYGLTFTAEATDTYVIKLGEGHVDHPIVDPIYPIAGGWSYLLNISVTGHAATAPRPTSGGKLDGGEGDDALIGGAVVDGLVGGAGNDRLYAGEGDDNAYGNAGDDLIQGDGGDDLLMGEQGRDTLLGGDGNDRLLGGSHSDALLGGSGDDWLNGGSNADRLNGGDGADTFVVGAPHVSGANDTITDFATGDRIAVKHGLVALARGTIEASLFHAGTEAADLDDRFIFDTDTGTLMFDADGSGAGAAFVLATLEGGAMLTAADIVVI